MNCATKSLSMIGLNGLLDSHWLNPLYQEAIRFKTLNEPDNGLKIILSLLCLQHAGVSINLKQKYIIRIIFPISLFETKTHKILSFHAFISVSDWDL